MADWFRPCVRQSKISNLPSEIIRARVVELADTRVLEALAARLTGSSPVPGTISKCDHLTILQSERRENATIFCAGITLPNLV